MSAVPESVAPVFTFWGESHKTQKSATAALRAYAETLPLNEVYLPEEPEFEHLREALHFNAEWAPLLHDIETLMFVRERGGSGARAMEVNMDDGSTRRVSWTRSFENRTEWDILMSALRLEVEDQIEAYAEPFRRMADPRSEMPGDPQPLFVNGKWTGHVDHIDPKFRDIARRFIYTIGGHPSLSPLPTGGRRITNPEIRRWWKEVHEKEAHLRVVTREQNLALEADRMTPNERRLTDFFTKGKNR